MNCGDHQTIKPLNIHSCSLCLKPVLSWHFIVSILISLNGFLPFLCGEFDQESHSSGIKWVLPSVGCRTSHPEVPVWSKLAERAHCLHTICTKTHRIILTIPEPWQIYSLSLIWLQALEIDLYDSATAKGWGGFPLLGIVLCTGGCLQDSTNPISGESAPSRHFMWLFLAVPVKISGLPAQLFL